VPSGSLRKPGNSAGGWKGSSLCSLTLPRDFGRTASSCIVKPFGQLHGTQNFQHGGELSCLGAVFRVTTTRRHTGCRRKRKHHLQVVAVDKLIVAVFGALLCSCPVAVLLALLWRTVSSEPETRFGKPREEGVAAHAIRVQGAPRHEPHLEVWLAATWKLMQHISRQ